MKRVGTLVSKFGCDERGATVIEYSLIAGFVSIAIFASVTQLGVRVNDLFQAVAKGFNP